MDSAERDRRELNTRIAQLEADNATLESKNAQTIEENRALLDQLEQLNSTVLDSETKVRGLEAALQTSQQAIRRLEGSTARAEDMERHISILESEQATLQGTISRSEEEARSAIYRWKKAERGVNDLQQQLERMERQVREERERHAEAMDRVERQRVVEKDLHTAAGRLKGAAAAKSLDENQNKGSVVSHFVRDLLQDNANLQLGIAELREMLNNSHDEIQLLREHLLHHQPVEEETSGASTLRTELGPSEQSPAPNVQSVSQELHVHHHYHVATPVQQKKTKKKRQTLSPGMFTPPMMPYPSTPPQNSWRPNRSCPGSANHSAKPSASTISVATNRWSLLSDQRSEFIPSSVPSTPQSNAGNLVFDQGAANMSMPTSPVTSADPASPCFRSPYGGREVQASTGTFPMPFSFPGDSYAPHGEREPQHTHPIPDQDVPSGGGEGEVESPSRPDTLTVVDSSHHTAASTTTADDSTIVMRHEDTESSGDSIPDTAEPQSEPDLELGYESVPDGEINHKAEPGREPEPQLESFDSSLTQFSRGIRRAVSHESILSLSNGLDIHTLKTRPAQLALRHLATPTADTGVSAVTASPTISRGGGEGKRGSVILRDNLGGLAGLGSPLPRTRESTRAVSAASVSGSSRQMSPAPRFASSGTRALGKLVSWRPWGGAAGGSTSTPTLVTEDTSSVSDTAASETLAAPVPTPAPAAQPSQSQTLSPPQESQLSISPSRSSKISPVARDFPRAPGINQPGAIPGFYEYWAAHQRRGPPNNVCPDSVDRDALRDSLGDT